LLTADASLQPLHQIIPAWTMGKEILNSVVMGVCKGGGNLVLQFKIQSSNVKIQNEKLK
jgi:hypothetical protein